jgi:hypothetical protein
VATSRFSGGVIDIFRSTTPSTINDISSLGRPFGSSEPKQPPGGKTRLPSHETGFDLAHPLNPARYRDNAAPSSPTAYCETHIAYRTRKPDGAGNLKSRPCRLALARGADPRGVTSRQSGPAFRPHPLRLRGRPAIRVSNVKSPKLVY